jgi:hypothetical protein
VSHHGSPTSAAGYRSRDPIYRTVWRWPRGSPGSPARRRSPRAGRLAVRRCNGVARLPLGGDQLLHHRPVPPVVPEVVDVVDLRPCTSDIPEADLPFVLGRRAPALPVVGAVANAVDLELVEVVAGPTERGLDGLVQTEHGHRTVNEEPTTTSNKDNPACRRDRRGGLATGLLSDGYGRSGSTPRSRSLAASRSARAASASARAASASASRTSRPSGARTWTTSEAGVSMVTPPRAAPS